MSISHIWFDFAGTLYQETEQFKELHDQFRFKAFAELKGISDMVIAQEEFLKLYQRHGSNSAVFSALGQPSDYWMKALGNMDFMSVLHSDPEVIDTIHALSSSVPISIFTNFNQARINELLIHLEIPTAFFTYILSGDDISERKPALDGFYEMIRRSESPPDRIAYVGDRVDVDVKPAKQLGMQTVLLYGESPLADHCFSAFSDLTVLL